MSTLGYPHRHGKLTATPAAARPQGKRPARGKAVPLAAGLVALVALGHVLIARASLAVGPPKHRLTASASTGGAS